LFERASGQAVTSSRTWNTNLLWQR